MNVIQLWKSDSIFPNKHRHLFSLLCRTGREARVPRPPDDKCTHLNREIAFGFHYTEHYDTHGARVFFLNDTLLS